MEDDYSHDNHPLLGTGPGPNREKRLARPSAWEMEPLDGRHRILRSCRSSSTHFYSWMAQLALFSVSLCMFTATALWRAYPTAHCVRSLSSPSPALDAVNEDYTDRQFSNHFYQPSIFAGPPDGDFVQAWDSIIDQRAFSIDEATLVAVGGHPENATKLESDLGGGYMAHLEVFHQLNCLKVLVQNTWPDSQHANLSNPRSHYRHYLSQCADLLRQKLECDADVSVVTYNWVRQMPNPIPNFNTMHKCRNFDTVLDWSAEHQIPLPENGAIHRTEDAVDLPFMP